MVLSFFGHESFSKGYNVLNEFMFQSHTRFRRMQWLATRFYGSLSVYSRPLPSEKIAPFAAQLEIAFRRFLLFYKKRCLRNYSIKISNPETETEYGIKYQ